MALPIQLSTGTQKNMLPLLPDNVDQDLIDNCLECIRTEQKASISLLQRRFTLGYVRALSIMEYFEKIGVVGPARGMEPREILIDIPAPKKVTVKIEADTKAATAQLADIQKALDEAKALREGLEKLYTQIVAEQIVADEAVADKMAEIAYEVGKLLGKDKA